MPRSRNKVLTKLKKTYIKMLRRYALGHMAKAHKLEEKAMLLEFELKEKNKRSHAEFLEDLNDWAKE